jgi:Uma2 family endonuclease
MVSQLDNPTKTDIIYPDTDGKPMANNTVQFHWILVIEQNLDWLFADDPQVFVAGDLFWYPLEGNNKVVNAPDIMVAFGRPKGDRGSYKQWEEGNIPPQVVFEILSPGNTSREMAQKLLFYERYGVEEYYVYDPDRHSLEGWLRGNYGLEAIEEIDRWCSPRLGVTFDLSSPELVIYRPDGVSFLSYNEISQRLIQESQRADQERQRADQERQRADQEYQEKEEAIRRSQQMEELVKEYEARFGKLS